ncbi:hypothetical protein JCM19046_3497 [Bacillus sp. JCM 19046]|nr:hypothetical protein JCM19045_4278 [Bacillus sp. JCM 19045]GAF18886.1 hypothetical protein JCM19046_3497 [Bacillus sp. JCM 19046]
MKRLIVSLLILCILSGCVRTIEGNAQKTLEQFFEYGERDVYNLDVDHEVQQEVAEVSSYELIELLEVSDGFSDIRKYSREEFESGQVGASYSTYEELVQDLLRKAEALDLEITEHTSDTIFLDHGNTLYDVTFKYEIESVNHVGIPYEGIAIFTVQARYGTEDERYRFSIVKDVVLE